MRRIPLHLRIQLARSRVQAVRVSRVTGKRLRRLDVQLGRQGGHDLRIRDLLRLHRLHVAGALDRLRVRGTRLADLRQRTLALGLRIGQRPRIAVTPRDHPAGHATGQGDYARSGNQRHQPTRTTLHALVLDAVLTHRNSPGFSNHPIIPRAHVNPGRRLHPGRDDTSII